MLELGGHFYVHRQAAARGNKYLAKRPAWYDVPQAIMDTLSKDAISSSVRLMFSLASPSISDILPAKSPAMPWTAREFP